MLDFPIQSFQFDPFKVWFNEEIFWLFLYLTYSLDPESIISLSHSFYSGLEADFSPKFIVSKVLNTVSRNIHFKIFN